MIRWPILLTLSCASESPPIRGVGPYSTDSGSSPRPTPGDADGDGTPDSGDCAPSNSNIGPNLPEIEGDGIDQNCDGLDRLVTDIRPFATSFWGDTNGANFGAEVSIAEFGDTEVALIGQPIPESAGRIFVISHPAEPMRRYMVQDEPYRFDDHLGTGMIGANVDSHPTLIAPYYLANGDQYLAGWYLDGDTVEEGPHRAIFNQRLPADHDLSAGSPVYGPDLTHDGIGDLFFIDTHSTSDILQTWAGPLQSSSVTTPPLAIELPEGVSDAKFVELVDSLGEVPDFAVVEAVDIQARYVHFFEAGADAGRIDIASASTRPLAHAARADMDGDGILERCVATPTWAPVEVETGAVACFSQTAGATLTVAEADTLLLGEIEDSAFGYDIAVADLDGDGRDELVVGAGIDNIVGRAGLIYILKLTDGMLTVHTTISDFGVDAGFGKQLGVGDLDGDGRPDVVATSYTACFDGASLLDPDAFCPGAVWVIPGAAGLW